MEDLYFHCTGTRSQRESQQTLMVEDLWWTLLSGTPDMSVSGSQCQDFGQGDPVQDVRQQVDIFVRAKASTLHLL